MLTTWTEHREVEFRPTKRVCNELHLTPPSKAAPDTREHALNWERFLLQKRLQRRIRIATNRHGAEHVRSTIALSLSADGTRLASTHGDHVVRTYRIRRGETENARPETSQVRELCQDTGCSFSLELSAELYGHPRTPWSVHFHPRDSDLMVSGCLGGHCYVWYRDQCVARYTVSEQHPENFAFFPEYGPSSISCVVFDPSGEVVIIAARRSLFFWQWRRTLWSRTLLRTMTRPMIGAGTAATREPSPRHALYGDRGRRSAAAGQTTNTNRVLVGASTYSAGREAHIHTRTALEDRVTRGDTRASSVATASTLDTAASFDTIGAGRSGALAGDAASFQTSLGSASRFPWPPDRERQRQAVGSSSVAGIVETRRARHASRQIQNARLNENADEADLSAQHPMDMQRVTAGRPERHPAESTDETLVEDSQQRSACYYLGVPIHLVNALAGASILLVGTRSPVLSTEQEAELFRVAAAPFTLDIQLYQLREEPLRYIDSAPNSSSNGDVGGSGYGFQRSRSTPVCNTLCPGVLIGKIPQVVAYNEAGISVSTDGRYLLVCILQSQLRRPQPHCPSDSHASSLHSGTERSAPRSHGAGVPRSAVRSPVPDTAHAPAGLESRNVWVRAAQERVPSGGASTFVAHIVIYEILPVSAVSGQARKSPVPDSCFLTSIDGAVSSLELQERARMPLDACHTRALTNLRFVPSPNTGFGKVSPDRDRIYFLAGYSYRESMTHSETLEAAEMRPILDLFEADLRTGSMHCLRSIPAARPHAGIAPGDASTALDWRSFEEVDGINCALFLPMYSANYPQLVQGIVYGTQRGDIYALVD